MDGDRPIGRSCILEPLLSLSRAHAYGFSQTFAFKMNWMSAGHHLGNWLELAGADWDWLGLIGTGWGCLGLTSSDWSWLRLAATGWCEVVKTLLEIWVWKRHTRCMAKKPCALQDSSSIPYSKCQSILFLWICLFYISQEMNGSTWLMPFWTGNVFKIHPHCSMQQNFIPFH